MRPARPVKHGKAIPFMKKIKRTQLTAAILALTAALTVTVLASSYDSSEDPIISLSYLTEIFKPSLVAEYEEKITALEKKLDTLSAQLTELSAEKPAEPEAPSPETTPAPEVIPPPTESTEKAPAAATYEVIEMKYGDCLFADGPVDLMLRAGKAICIAPDAGQGLSDYTEGKEIYNGESLTKNHMCLIPRGDGRGIMATAESVFIMVKGAYTLVQS